MAKHRSTGSGEPSIERKNKEYPEVMAANVTLTGITPENRDDNCHHKCTYYGEKTKNSSQNNEGILYAAKVSYSSGKDSAQDIVSAKERSSDPGVIIIIKNS